MYRIISKTHSFHISCDVAIRQFKRPSLYVMLINFMLLAQCKSVYHWVHYSTLPIIQDSLFYFFWALWETADEVKQCVVQILCPTGKGTLQRALVIPVWPLLPQCRFSNPYNSRNRIVCMNRNRKETNFSPSHLWNKR